MNTYTIRIRCSSFKDIDVVAESEDSAINDAIRSFNCEGASPEFEETLNVEPLPPLD